jgi:Flp pilus assembly protein TadD
VLSSPVRRRRALLVGLVALVLAVSGCGSNDEKSSASQGGKAKSTSTPKPANGY